MTILFISPLHENEQADLHNPDDPNSTDNEQLLNSLQLSPQQPESVVLNNSSQSNSENE